MQQEGPNFEAETEVEVTMKRAMFEVESVPLHYMRTPATYQNDLRVKKLSYTSVVENACHFWRVGFP